MGPFSVYGALKAASEVDLGNAQDTYSSLTFLSVWMHTFKFFHVNINL